MAHPVRTARLASIAGLVYWAFSIAVWVAFIFYEAHHTDPLAIIALWLPLVVTALLVPAALYWVFGARPALNRGSHRPALVVAIVSWTTASLFLLLLVVLALIG